MKLFGFDSSSETKSLPSYEDQNVLVKTAGKKFVLKIYNHTASEEFIKFQNLVLDLLFKNSVSVAQIQLSTQNKSIEFTKKGNMVVLLSYLEGIPFGDALDKVSYMENIGTELAKLDSVLCEFDHEEAHRKHDWDILNTDELSPKISHIKNEENNAIATYYVNLFIEFKPKIQKLRRQIIHGDVNDYNIILGENGSVRFIDFGDLIYTQTICDLAICLAYLSIYFSENPIDGILPTLRSYHKHFPISNEELEVLFPLLCSRLAMSVIQSTYFSDPENPYISISQGKAWDTLKYYHQNVSHESALLIFKDTLKI
jgi:Ser/Thr protein kinase RdoA (MazF antagonist)